MATDIYTLGFDKLLNRGESPLLNSLPALLYDSSTILNPVSESIPSEILQSGEMSGIYFNGKTSFTDSTNGFRQGIDIDGTYKWIIGTTGNSVDFNVTTANTLTISGALSASTIDIGGADATSFHVDIDGNLWLGAATYATSTARISNAGAATFSSMTITGGSISSTPISAIPNSTATDISLLEKSHNLVFSVTDADTIAWATGTIIFSNGRTFAIDAGNTGNMAALTYIYLDTGVSSTVLQTTTTYSTAMGANRSLLGMAQNNTITASFIPYGAGQPLIDGSQIGALSIVAANIAASTITAGKLSVATLSAITADLGTITAGSISVVNGGNTIGFTPAGANAIFSGPTGAPTFAVTPAGVLTATGAIISGYALTTRGSFGGSGADGALSISSGTTTIDLGSANVYILNYTSVSITGTAKLAFSNPASTGTKVIIKSQGAVTITSSDAQAIDCRSLGATAGSAPAINNTGNAGTTIHADLILDASNHHGLGGPIDTPAVSGGAIFSNLNFYPSTSNRMIRKFIEAPPGCGGGSGGSASAGTTGVGGVGGRGGGSLIIECGGAYNVSSTFSVAGANGSNGGDGDAGNGGGGGGGGGSSGTIIIMYNTLTSDTGTYTVTGGNGGNGGAPSGAGGASGGGGSGAGSFNGTGGDGGRGDVGLNNQANGSDASGTSGGSGGTKGAGANGGGGGGGGAGGFAIRVQNNFFA